MPSTHTPHLPPGAAGVDTDLEEAGEVLRFAKSLELVNKGEAGNLKVGLGPAAPHVVLKEERQIDSLRCAAGSKASHQAEKPAEHDSRLPNCARPA